MVTIRSPFLLLYCHFFSHFYCHFSGYFATMYRMGVVSVCVCVCVRERERERERSAMQWWLLGKPQAGGKAPVIERDNTTT